MYKSKKHTIEPLSTQKLFNILNNLEDEETMNFLAFSRFVVAGPDAVYNIALAYASS